MTPQQIIDIFSTGKIRNWNEVGGPNLAIVPVVRPPTSGTRATFRKYILGGRDENGRLQKTDSSLTFIGIALVGWLISGTLVRRLKDLRRVTQAVEQGKLNERVTVVGRDEIADVSASVNAMLDTILSLLAESRSQRDALTNAAEHLFTDMRVNAPVSNDPIGMLANAFNFTVGRFRRFVLRTHGAVEQIDVIVRQEIERVETFLQALNKLSTAPSTPSGRSTPSGELRAAGGTGKETQTELVRLSFDFASEIVAHSRKLTALTQEMRQGAISFQLDAANSSDPPTPSQSLNTTQGNDVVPGVRPQMASPRGRYAPAVNREASLPGSQAYNYEPDSQRPTLPDRFKRPSTKTDQS